MLGRQRLQIDGASLELRHDPAARERHHDRRDEQTVEMAPHPLPHVRDHRILVRADPPAILRPLHQLPQQGNERLVRLAEQVVFEKERLG